MIIAQLSDPHITDGQDEPSIKLERAVAHLMQLPARPDVVLITGDCVENGRRSEYDQFQALIRPLPMPMYVVPGNHDVRTNFLAVFGPQGNNALEGFAQYTVEDWPVRLIALDTHIPSEGGGLLCEDRLAWLAERLEEQPAQPTIIFMHHPPFMTGLTGFDRIGLRGADGLASIVTNHTEVERFLAGHVHAAMLRRFAGTVAMTCPSTMYQMVSDFNEPVRLRVHMQPPSCLLHVWNTTTGLLTHTSLIGEYGQPLELFDGTRWL